MRSGPEELQLPHLETFAKAAELNSFTRAAEALHVTQAAVSQRVQALEKELGVPVFQRQGGQILLTEAGQHLYTYAQQILELHQEARAAVTGHRPVLSGDLLLAASSVPGEHLLPALLVHFRQLHPQVRLSATVTDSQHVLAEVEQGKVHLGLVGRKGAHPHLEFQQFAADHMVLVVPPGHAWRERKQVTLNELCTQPLILREAGSGLRWCLEKNLGRLGKSLEDLLIAAELGSNEAIKEAVVRGLGVAILSQYAVQRELDAGHLLGLRVTDLPCDRDIHLVWDRRRVLPRPARIFRHFLETHPVSGQAHKPSL